MIGKIDKDLSRYVYIKNADDTNNTREKEKTSFNAKLIANDQTVKRASIEQLHNKRYRKRKE